MSTARLVPSNGPTYVHITMAQRLLGDHEYVVRGLVVSGELPSVKIDGRTYIAVNEVAAYRERRDSGQRRVESTESGEALAVCRKAAGFSRHKVADAAGVSRSKLARVERGEHLPTEAWVWRVTQALGLLMVDRRAQSA